MLRLPSWLSGKESAFQAGDMSLIPGSGRSAMINEISASQYGCGGEVT